MESQMNIEQIARNFVMALILEPEKVKDLITADAMASGGALPQALPIAEAAKNAVPFKLAMPDYKVEFDSVTLNGNEATVKVHMSGTQTGLFKVGWGIPDVPATGKKVWVRDAMVVTVQGDKVSKVRIESPADGGLPEILKQLGVQMPVM
jgi:predicted ester cyclase